MAGLRVLHVDDDPRSLEMRASILEDEFDYSVAVASNADEALSQLETADFDCILSDYKMPDTDGIELLSIVKERYPDLPFILFTGVESEEVAEEAFANGATDYIPKSLSNISYDLLAERIDQAVTQQHIIEQLERIADTPLPEPSLDYNDGSVTTNANNTLEDDVPLEVLFESPVTTENGDQAHLEGRASPSKERKDLLAVLREAFVDETSVDKLFEPTESGGQESHQALVEVQPEIKEPFRDDEPEPDRSVLEDDRLVTLIYEAFGESTSSSESELILGTSTIAEGSFSQDKDDKFFDTISQLLQTDEQRTESKVVDSTDDGLLESLLLEEDRDDKPVQGTPVTTDSESDNRHHVVDGDQAEASFFEILVGVNEDSEESGETSVDEDHRSDWRVHKRHEETTSVDKKDRLEGSSTESVLFDKLFETLASTGSHGASQEIVETRDHHEESTTTVDSSDTEAVIDGVVMEPSADSTETVEEISDSTSSRGPIVAKERTASEQSDYSAESTAISDQLDEQRESNRKHVSTHEENIVEQSSTTIRSDAVTDRHDEQIEPNEKETGGDDEETVETVAGSADKEAIVTDRDEESVAETSDAKSTSPESDEDSAIAYDNRDTAKSTQRPPAARLMPSFDVTDHVTDHVSADHTPQPETVVNEAQEASVEEADTVIEADDPPVEPGQISDIADLSKEQLVQLIGRLTDDYSAAGTAEVTKPTDAQEETRESEPAEESDQEVVFEQEVDDTTESPTTDPSLEQRESESVEWTDGADYERPDGLELTPGGSYLIQCQSQDERGHTACADLLRADQMAGNNVILVRYRQLNDDRLAELAVAANDMKIIAVGYQQPIPNELSEEIDVIQINNPNDLTRLGIVITGVLDKWNGSSDQTMVCFDPLNILLQYKQVRNVFRFLHVLLGRLRSADAISHFHIDPTAGDPQEVSVLKPLFDDVMTIDYLGAQLE